MVVDFRSRLLAFRGAGGEPQFYVSLLSVSPARLSRKEGFGSDTSHEENLKLNFRGVSHLALQSTSLEAKKPPEQKNPPGWLFLLCMHNLFFILGISLYFPAEQSSSFLCKLLKMEGPGNASLQD